MDELKNIGRDIMNEIKSSFGDVWKDLNTTQREHVQKAVDSLAESSTRYMMSIDAAAKAAAKRDMGHAYNVLTNVGATGEQKLKAAVRKSTATVFQNVAKGLVTVLMALA